MLLNMKNSLTILLYHGVTDKEPKGIENYSGKHIKKEDFYKQMSYIKKNCVILSINEVVEHYLNRKAFSGNSVAVTFDDGFKNNYTNAVPILEELGIPAVFYISTGFIGNDKMFWVDVLEDSINRCEKRKIKVNLSGPPVIFQLGTPELKIRAIEEIKRYCKQVNNTKKNRVLLELQEETRVASHSSFDNYLKMDWNAVKKLDSNPLFTIGGHTENHSILAALPLAEMKLEIEHSLTALEENLNHKIMDYSYPEGQRCHYNNDVIGVLKEKGIRCCPSAVHGINTLEDDLFHLKRIMVGFLGTEFPYS